MDIRTGKTYESIEEARKDSVPESDIAHIDSDGNPSFTKLKFTKGSFKPVTVLKK